MLRGRTLGRRESDIEAAIREAEVVASSPARPVDYLAAHDSEQYWRGRGEIAIREEMEAALERRKRRRAGILAPGRAVA